MCVFFFLVFFFCSFFFPHRLQEFTRPRCFDGAYVRGLWAAGFSFYAVRGAAVFSSAEQSTKGCRPSGLPMEGYSAFLKVNQLFHT